MAMALWLAALAVVLEVAAADVFLYGARHEVPHYGYGYIGLDWPEEYATCSGVRQSPINIPGHSAFARVPDGEETRLNYGMLASNGSNVKVVNNGHTVQVVLPTDYQPDVSIFVRGEANVTKLATKFGSQAATTQRVRINPVQFHFHTRSEHVLDGKEYVLELHIVNWVYQDGLSACAAMNPDRSGSCATVVGVVFELEDSPHTTDNPFLEHIWSMMPKNEGESAFLPSGTTLNFDEILPADKSYITYEGSLTTPPCTEGILWHVLTTPQKITRSQLTKFELAVGNTQCSGHHHRHLLIADSTTPDDKAQATTPVDTGALAPVDTGAPKKLPAAGASGGSSNGSSSSSTVEKESSVGGTPAAAGASGTFVASRSAGSATSPAPVEEFTVPDYQRDNADGLMCRKLAGTNYREVQDRDDRPIWFYAAPGLCEPQLNILNSRSTVLKKLVGEADVGKDGITLHQYNDIVSSGLTKAAGCAGITSRAHAAWTPASLFLQACMAGLLLCWMLALQA